MTINSFKTGTPKRQNAGRVDHVTLMVAMENHEPTVRRFELMLGIEFSPSDTSEVFGAMSSVAWDAGIEIMSPLTADGVYAEWLRDNGEGCFAVCFGVQDLNDAVERAVGAGATVEFKGDGLAHAPSWAARFERLSVAQLKPVHGTTFCLEEIVLAEANAAGSSFSGDRAKGPA